ncbi:TonB-dependent receptor domain-containing protein [Sphingosinicella terrae]|uniref:TonB-dependent receptor domain-containing protein n=1 Tax=Sphingosinicella terrae TaxID=2172047 RepID=UPI000E0DE827|nr:TonB-dependent receptor [Sphingosinicella terrae]
MKKLNLLSTSAIGSAALFGMAIAFASPAHAQNEQDSTAQLDTEQEIESGEAADEGETLVITGSRIRRPNLESVVPTTSVGGEEFFETGQTSVGDTLNELPALRSTFSQSNSTRFLGTAGLNLLDLRGLNTQRTLVLVNGRRHVGSDILSNAVSPDVNTFPTDLIERVDLVTGGNSAIYGSDAIAGVVNFILRRDFEGIQMRGQGAVTTYGDGGSYYGSLLAGHNFGDGRGNVAINLEYAHQEDVYAPGRPNLRQNDNFVVVDTDPGGTPNGADGNPDRVFFRDIRFATLSVGGQVGFASPTGACGRDALGNPFTCAFVFQPDGTLVPQTGTRVGLAPNGNFIGGNGINNRERRSFGLFPQLDRYSANLIAHYTFSPALEAFIEAKYVRTESLGSTSGPAFFQGSTIEPPAGIPFTGRERPRLDNPFLTAQARALITEQLIASGVPAASITDSTRFLLRKNILEIGDREEEATRETWRIVAGVRGDIAENWNYELSANYGEFEERTVVGGNLNVQRFALAMDAVRDPATGNIVCRSQIDPAAAVPYPFVDPAVAEANLAADVAACVPLNPFGVGNVTPEMRNYLVTDAISEGRISQFVLNGFISGDSSRWFELPGGPIGVAIGAEYRRETAFFQTDENVANGLTFYNALPLFDPPAFEVKELFGELRFPILANTPFFEELTASVAGRASDYKGATGTVYAYNAGLEWAPIRDIRFRGNYSRAVRAPNLADLFSDQSQNFAPGFNDPCSARNIGAGSATRAANCAADGRPGDYDYVYVESLEILSGGNPDLREETSDSWTFGAVIQPRFIPGLSVSVDYYDITVDDVITAPTAQQIVNACYDAASLDNPFCDLFERNTGPGDGPAGEIPFRILEGTLQQTLLNYAQLTARGIDIEAAYRHDFEGIGRLNARLNYTHVLERNQYLNPADPGRADRLLSELGDPQDSFNLNVSMESGPVTVGYQMRYISKMVVNFYEDFFSVQGRAPENADWADRIWYPSVLYHDIRVGFDVTEDYNFYVGIDNFTNRLPPLGLTGVGGGSGIYDNRGRNFYAGFRARF